jgi:hypothetical protein
MADTAYTRALTRAAEIQGSTQALASLLHVPENTLFRWMTGRAQMPVAAFIKVIEIISEDERGRAPVSQEASAAPAPGEKLRFRLAHVEGCCARCDGVEFMQADPSLAMRYITELVCCSCGQKVVHGDLVAQMARDSVHQSKAMAIARQKRQAMALRKHPNLRLLDGAKRDSEPPAEAKGS